MEDKGKGGFSGYVEGQRLRSVFLSISICLYIYLPPPPSLVERQGKSCRQRGGWGGGMKPLVVSPPPHCCSWSYTVLEALQPFPHLCCRIPPPWPRRCGGSGTIPTPEPGVKGVRGGGGRDPTVAEPLGAGRDEVGASHMLPRPHLGHTSRGGP